MSKVSADISMSIDGFIAGPDDNPDQGLGAGGERLHEWAFNGENERNREVLEQGIKSIGAVIGGRRTYDNSIRWWGADGPTGPARVPLFVVTHSVPDQVPEEGVYTFVTEGIEEALVQAKRAAGGKDISVMGGAEIIQQYLNAGLLDELSIHLVPVLLGNGRRLFKNLEGEHIELETVRVIETEAAVHLHLRVIK